MKIYSKLDQLTALRFFAALMIVVHHSVGIFGVKSMGVNWGQGVSFFFVLSGFIITYVYPRLETYSDVKKFWRARFARIWPAYFACFVLGFLLIPFIWDTKTALANLLMIQAWIPLSSYYFSYNAVSWSVSTEAFFYLAFPILIYKWNQYWKVKFLLSGLVLISLLLVSNYLQLPAYGNPYVGADGLLVTQHGLIYISPISRIFEFILGMVIATLWLKRNWSDDSIWATVYEMIAVVLCVASMYYGNDIAQVGRESPLGASAAKWLGHSGSLFSFGLLIYVIAQGRGRLSKILSSPFLVLLGEISFSMYLIHQIVLTVYRQNMHSLSHVPDGIALLAFVLILLTSSYLMWVCVEMPGRRFLLGRGEMHGTLTMKKSWHDHKPADRKTAVAGLVLLCLVATIYLTARRPFSAVWIDETSKGHWAPTSDRQWNGSRATQVLHLYGGMTWGAKTPGVRRHGMRRCARTPYNASHG